MSEEQNQATPDAAESELADTWEQAAKPVATPEAGSTAVETDQPEGDAGDTEGDEDEGDKGEEERRKKKSTSERLRQKNARLMERIAQLESGAAPVAAGDEAGIAALVAKKVGEPPKEADFGGDWFAYERAMTAFEADKRQVTRQVKESVEQSHQAEQTRVSEMLDDYVERCEEVAKTLTDFKQVVSNPEFKTTNLVKRLILDAGEKAPLVAYNLAQNPKLCARINAMSPIEAAREVGRIEGRVSLPKNNATRASPPLSSVKGGASPQRGLGKSMSDYERWRNS